MDQLALRDVSGQRLERLPAAFLFDYIQAKVEWERDFGADLMIFQVCTGPGTGCSNTMFRLEPAEDGLESTRSNTSTAGSCNLYAGISRLSLDGDVATFEDRQWSSFDVPESDCTLEAADALIGTPDCQDVVVWVGTRL